MKEKEKSSLSLPDALDSRAASKMINEKLKEGWVKTNDFHYDAERKIFTYYFERESGVLK